MSSFVIAHLDMDAFFAAVEQRDNPKLIGQPVIIGADPKDGAGRGVVSTCSYEARRFGIHSAMPISIAFKKCPHGIFLRGNLKKYKDASLAIFQILEGFTPDIEPISIDEAFFDMTGCFHFFKTPLLMGKAIKEKIKKEVRLNASIGIAPNKMVAKIASDFCKPNGLIEIKEDKILDFLWPLDVGRLWGVGHKTKEQLTNMGIRTIGDLAQLSETSLVHRFGTYGQKLFRLSHGIDNRIVSIDDEVKSVSNEHTFDEDVNDKEIINKTLVFLSEKVSTRLRKKGLKGRTINLKIRLKGFKTYTRSVTLDTRENFFDVIYDETSKMFEDFFVSGMFVRLIGVKVTHLEDLYVSDDLFVDPKKVKKESLHKAVDHIKERYGDGSIHRAL